jgi:hypothetical protein
MQEKDMAVAPFQDLYPFTTFETIADAAWWRKNDFNRRSPLSDEDRAAHDVAAAQDAVDDERIKEHKKVFVAAVREHLSNLVAAGRLQPIAGVAGREIDMADAWNALVGGTDGDHTRKWLFDKFSGLLIREFVSMDSGRYSRKNAEGHVAGTHVPPTREMAIKAWSTICAKMNLGTSEEYTDGMLIECTDRKTGDRCEIHFEDWKATLMRRNDRHELEPALDVAKPDLVVAEFKVPSGRLLLTDVLRVEGFVKAIEFEPDREYGELDLNSSKGKDARIKAHAEDHDIAYTQTTNTCVAIHRNDLTGCLMITERWFSDRRGNEMPEDANRVSIVKGWTSLGAFSCDRWCVMAFDRETALSLMKAGGCEDPASKLDAYLSSGDSYADNVVGLYVEPGLWRIRSGDDFSNRVSRRKWKIPTGVRVWCLLERAGD